MSATMRMFVLPIALAFCFVASMSAKNGAYRATAHGNAEKGVQRRSDAQRGSCAQCHDQHGARGSSSRGNHATLFTANDNDLCFSCHAKESQIGIYGGRGRWTRSSHALSPDMVRRGRDGREAADVNKCVNCHDPHGVRDERGVVPSMLAEREEELCLSCHDGSSGADIRSQMQLPYFHGAFARGEHDATEASNPERLAASERHVACSDCHNVHEAGTPSRATVAPDASERLRGVSRIEVVNGMAGSIPSYRFRPASESNGAKEYEICFKCHSSWSRQKPGAADLARLTNPANPSYHPIQARGKNRIDPNAFTRGYSAETIVRCTDCHGTDDRSGKGMHGSSNDRLLKKRIVTSNSPQRATREELCFDCHSFEVYADTNTRPEKLAFSRFNAPSTAGHAFHVGSRSIPCLSCHEAHGSTRYAALISTGRMTGIFNYTQTPSGGSCMTSCHEAKQYTLNYAR